MFTNQLYYDFRFLCINRDVFEFGFIKLRDNFQELFSPSYLTEIAIETGFCKRGSKFTPQMFIDILLYNASSDANKSLNQLTIEALDEHGIHVSRQGIDKKFNEHSVAFIKAVFEKNLTTQIKSQDFNVGWLEHFEQVRIKDGTRFDIPEPLFPYMPGFGGSASKAGACIQYEFDIKSGKILDLTITPANRQDVTDSKETIGDVTQGVLVLRDLGYFTLSNIQKIIENKAFVISRLDPKTLVSELKDGKYIELDFEGLYDYMKKNSLGRMEKQVYIGKTMLIPIRMVIELMPEEVYQKRIRSVNKGNKKKGYHTSDRYKIKARFNLFITNVPSDKLPGLAISGLYKIRWQIELIFKIWKSTFGIHHTRKMKYHRWLCLLYAKLLTIVIFWDIILIHRNEYYIGQGKMLSFDKCFKTIKESLVKFRKAIWKGKKAIEDYMRSITKKLSSNHWLERKKKNIGFEEILYLMFCKSNIYVYF